MNQIEINGTLYLFDSKEGDLLSFLREQGVVCHAVCGGGGRCGKCKVQYLSHPPLPSEHCIAVLSQNEIESGYRLACAHSLSNARIQVIDHSMLSIEIGFDFPDIKQPRQVNYQNVELEDIESESDSFYHFVQKKYGLLLSNSMLRKLSTLLSKESDGLQSNQIVLAMLDNQVATVLSDHKPPILLNLDIGSTTLALSAVESGSHQLIAKETCLNKQAHFAADIINRISLSNEGEFNALCEAIRNSCLMLISRIAGKIDLERVAELNIVGNLTMVHFLLRFNPILIGVSPFLGLKNSHSTHSFNALFYDNQLECNVNILPGYSAYVGADIVAGVSYLNMYQTQSINLFVDLGTNGELVIGNKERLLATSTACGPAFEGGHLECGMPAFAGAVSKVRKGTSGSFELDTIAGVTPIGLCGSAAIELLAHLLDNGDVDNTGLLKADFNQKVALADQVYFSQKDIRELQLAKSAVRTAIDILIDEFGCHYQDIDQVYLSGGFGSNVSIKSLVRIGVFPNPLESKIIAKGNTALAGAVKYSLSANRDDEIRQIVQSMRRIELAKNNKFNQFYTENMLFDSAVKSE